MARTPGPSTSAVRYWWSAPNQRLSCILPVWFGTRLKVSCSLPFSTSILSTSFVGSTKAPIGTGPFPSVVFTCNKVRSRKERLSVSRDRKAALWGAVCCLRAHGRVRITDGALAFCMAAGRRFRCPPGPEFWSVDTRPLTEVFAFLKPPCISFGPPFDSNDRGLPAERMSLSVSVVPVSSCSSAARSILFGPRPVVRWPFARRGDCGLPLDILSTPRAGRRRTDGTGVRTQRNECKSRVHRGRRSPPPPWHARVGQALCREAHTRPKARDATASAQLLARSASSVHSLAGLKLHRRPCARVLQHWRVCALGPPSLLTFR